MKQKKIAIAFAGSGAVRPLTVTSLLNDWLGFGEEDGEGFYEPSDHEIELFFPVSQAHWNDEIDKVLKWSAKADLPYNIVLEKGERGDEFEFVVEDASKTIEAVNVSKALVDALDDADAEEKYVVLLWNDEDEEAENVLTLADIKNIPAKDLSDGLDDLSFDDGEEEPEPAPAPEPDPEPAPEPRRRRGSRRSAQEEEPEAEEPKETPLDTEEEEIEEEPAPKPTRSRRAKEEKPEPQPEEAKSIPPSEPEYVSTDGVNIDQHPVDKDLVENALRQALSFHEAQDVMFAARNMSDEVKPSPLSLALREALVSLKGKPVVKGEEPLVDAWGKPAAEEPEGEAPKRGRGRPRTREQVVGYLHHTTTNTYRKAGKGRPRKGEVKVDLTAEQVADLNEQGLIVDED